MALGVMMLFSCGNPDAMVRTLAADDTLSGIVADSIVFIRSDSGRIEMKLTASQMIRQDGDSSSLEFPKGFVSVFFDKHQNKTSELTADYGKNYGSLIEAAGNVNIINFGNNEKLFSDKLYWYQDTRMIHTRSHVRIVTPDKEIEGDSLVAKEDFSEYTIYNGNALLELDEDL